MILPGIFKEVNMTTISYPAVFHKEDGGYWVSFPDLPGCLTQGETIEEAFQMACEALGLYLDQDGSTQNNFAKPTQTDYVIRDNKNDIVMLVTYDSLQYARKYKTRSVKKTLSVPEWLNELAVKANVNFSQVLQDALIEKLCKKPNE